MKPNSDLLFSGKGLEAPRFPAVFCPGSAVLLGKGRVWIVAMPLRQECSEKKLVVGLTLLLIEGLHT